MSLALVLQLKAMGKTEKVTTIIDAIAFGVPCIEYFLENEYFKSIYPAGSSFRQLGILWADDSESFRRCLETLNSEDYQIPDATKQLGHEMNLSIFDGK